MNILEVKKNKTGVIRGTLLYSNEIASNNNNYLKCKIGSEVDEITVNVFENSKDENENSLYEKILTLPKEGAICEFKLRYDGRNGKYENFSILDINVLRLERNIEVVDIKIIKQKFTEIAEEIEKEEPLFASLVRSVYSNKKIRKNSFTAPYSENAGYNFIGGNSVQALRLCYLCKSIADTYNNWDLSLDNMDTRISIPILYTASLLSDVGKILAYEFDGKEVVKTFDGQLHNDSVLTLNIIDRYLEKSELSDLKKSMLMHIIASSKESCFGGLEVPRTREAIIFNAAKKINSVMGAFETMDRDCLGDFYKAHQKTYCLKKYSDIE